MTIFNRMLMWNVRGECTNKVCVKNKGYKKEIRST